MLECRFITLQLYSIFKSEFKIRFLFFFYPSPAHLPPPLLPSFPYSLRHVHTLLILNLSIEWIVVSSFAIDVVKCNSRKVRKGGWRQTRNFRLFELLVRIQFRKNMAAFESKIYISKRNRKNRSVNDEKQINWKKNFIFQLIRGKKFKNY